MSITKENHLDADAIIEAARQEDSKQRLYYEIAKHVCDMITVKWDGRKINKRLATDAYKVINDNVPGLFTVYYDTRYGMYHLEITYTNIMGLQPKSLSGFRMSMLVGYEGTPVINAERVTDHNKGYLLGLERGADIALKMKLVPAAVKHYNKAINVLQDVKKLFGDAYPYVSYFSFEASKEVKD